MYGCQCLVHGQTVFALVIDILHMVTQSLCLAVKCLTLGHAVCLVVNVWHVVRQSLRLVTNVQYIVLVSGCQYPALG